MKCRYKKIGQNHQRRDEDGKNKGDRAQRAVKVLFHLMWPRTQRKQRTKRAEDQGRKVVKAGHVRNTMRCCSCHKLQTKAYRMHKKSIFSSTAHWCYHANMKIWSFSICLYRVLISGRVTWSVASIHLLHRWGEIVLHATGRRGAAITWHLTSNSFVYATS